MEKLIKLIKSAGFSWKRMLCLLGGNLGYALTLNFFLNENNIAAGGFAGLGMIVSSFVPVSIGLFVFLLSIPLLVWAYFAHGLKYVLSTLFSTVVYSAMLDIFTFVPTLTNDRMLASICGGVLYGASALLLLWGRSSGGGTDLLGRLLITRFRHISLGTMFILCDGFVVVLSILAYGDIESGIYAMITLAVSSYVTDWAIGGFNKACVFQVITGSPPDDLARAVMTSMERGVTCMRATGMYRNSERNVLLIAVRPKEVYILKDLIRAHAPDAFAMLTPASEIVGEGFMGLDATKSAKELK